VSQAAARWLVVAGAALGGLVIGSFLNVVAYRAPRGLSVVRPGSFCPECSTPVGAFDNVPVVSWVLLRGKCRTCRAPISARYPLVEAGTALLFALAATAVGPHPAVIGLCAVAAGAAASLAVELDGEALPPAVPGTAAGLGLAALAAATALDGHWAHLAGAAIGTLAGTLAAALAAARAAARGGVRTGSRRFAHGSARGPASQQDQGRAGPWALVPAGTAAGWAGPVGAAAGAAVVAVGLLALWVTSGPCARSPAPRAGPGAGRASAPTRVGPAAIAMAAAVVSVAAAFASGAGLS